MENGTTTFICHGVKKTVIGNISAFQKLILLLLVIATTACQPTAHASKENTMIQLNLSVWQLIEDIQAAPFTLAGIEKILGQTLVEQMQKSNEYFQFFAGQELALAGNSSIVKIDLRLPRDTNDRSGLLVLNLDGECISLQQVKRQFPDLALTDMPRGDSPEQATTFTASNAWGEVSFGFQQKKPDCLGYLVFEPGE